MINEYKFSYTLKPVVDLIGKLNGLLTPCTTLNKRQWYHMHNNLQGTISRQATASVFIQQWLPISTFLTELPSNFQTLTYRTDSITNAYSTSQRMKQLVRLLYKTFRCQSILQQQRGQSKAELLPFSPKNFCAALKVWVDGHGRRPVTSWTNAPWTASTQRPRAKWEVNTVKTAFKWRTNHRKFFIV